MAIQGLPKQPFQWDGLCNFFQQHLASSCIRWKLSISKCAEFSVCYLNCIDETFCTTPLDWQSKTKVAFSCMLIGTTTAALLCVPQSETAARCVRPQHLLRSVPSATPPAPESTHPSAAPSRQSPRPSAIQGGTQTSAILLKSSKDANDKLLEVVLLAILTLC